MAIVEGAVSASTCEELPEGVPPKPQPEKFEPPVAWLFGRQFIANFKWIMLYTAFKGKLDPRDWMKAEVIPDRATQAEVEQFWKDWQRSWDEPEKGAQQTGQEFWFDYISDTGDGQRAVYSIAYLALSDLAVSKNPQPGEAAGFVGQASPSELDAAGQTLLPRGTFLFVGGDTGYHISDYGTLAIRFQNPFWWAFCDLKKSARSVLVKVPRLLFGIPGNHDYYDSLDGFNRQFRRPSTGETPQPGKRPPMLRIPTFRREQEASYIALRLPFDWWFWGMDTEEGEIDFRQLEFFNDIREKYAPKKLIVATPEPTTVFGKYAREDENQAKTFKALKLERPFLKNAEPLLPGKCRVDLSGDIHHYARYWGATPASQSKTNYASVMAGGGGAFFHPSHTTIKELSPQMLYPPAEDSRAKLADEIFKFTNIWKGGYIWLFGAVMTFVLFFSASFPQSSKDTIDSFPPFVRLGISPPVSAQTTAAPPTYVKPMPRYTWGVNAPEKSSDFYLWAVLLLASIVALGAALLRSASLFKKEYEPEGMKRKEVTLQQRLPIWGLVLFGFICLSFGIWGFYQYEPALTRYARSLLILTALVWAVLAVVESVRYSEWLFEESYKENVEAWHYWPIWILLIMAVLGFGASLWLFGKHESAFLISDLLQLSIILGAGLGLTYFAYDTGASLQKGLGKVGFVLLGASHAFLQLSVPFLLVRKGHLLWAPVAALLVVVLFKFVGRSLARLKNGWPLALAWILFGAALVAIPFMPFLSAETLNMPDGRGMKFLLCLYAGAIGAVMSCVLFGSYLAVSLAFNGHNNEAGGAARIEGFKQLIRFRLNRDGLTGYVIGIDKSGTDGSQLRPKLVDVFHICEQ